MTSHFSRIITLLRKEKGISQKNAAMELGVSQALLSHYEKGIRECGLGFLVRVADFYGVSADYLLGRTPDRSGTFLTVEDIPEPDAAGKENVLKGSILPTLNKKLLANSLNIVFSELQKTNNKALTTEVSQYLSVSLYKIFRVLYNANPKNPQGIFSLPYERSVGFSDSLLGISYWNAVALCKGQGIDENKGVAVGESLSMSPEGLSNEYPLFANSLLNLIQNSETKMEVKKPVKSGS